VQEEIKSILLGTYTGNSELDAAMVPTVQKLRIAASWPDRQQMGVPLDKRNGGPAAFDL
jgi:hypothetical protein